MLKLIKKLQMPTTTALYGLSSGGGGGAGGASTLYTANPALNTNDGNAGFSFRVSVPINGTAGTQVRVTIRPGTDGALTITNASIGKHATTGTGWETTAIPIELKFATLSGFASATTDKVSDWTNLSGLTFTTGERAIIIYDIPAAGPARQRYAPASTGVNTYYKSAAQTWNQSLPASVSTLTDINYCIVALETQ